MSSAPAEISLEAVVKRYGARLAVDGIDLDLRAGRITCLLGPSGCGKSTLLRLIAGLETPDGGRVLAGGRELAGPGGFVAPEQRGVGLVFQDYALFPHLSVLQNVAFGLRGQPRSQARERALALLAQVRLADRAAAWPHTLSGGEQQRVALARALAREPAAILLDEPFSGLDSHLKASVRETLIATLRAAGTAVLVVTHDAEEALLMADDLVLMDRGRIIQRGPPRECYVRPASVAAARMLGEVNVLPATVAGGRARTAFGDLAAAGLPDGAASLLIRPEALRLAPAGVQAEVVDVRFGGHFHDVFLRLGAHRLRSRTVADPPSPGASVRLLLTTADAAVLVSEPDGPRPLS